MLPKNFKYFFIHKHFSLYKVTWLLLNKIIQFCKKKKQQQQQKYTFNIQREIICTNKKQEMFKNVSKYTSLNYIHDIDIEIRKSLNFMG